MSARAPRSARTAVAPPGSRHGMRGSARRRELNASWLSRISSARRVALILVALFEITEVAILWGKGFEHQNGIAVVLGFIVLVLLLAFELAEHSAMKRDHELSQEISEW